MAFSAFVFNRFELNRTSSQRLFPPQIDTYMYLYNLVHTHDLHGRLLLLGEKGIQRAPASKKKFSWRMVLNFPRKIRKFGQEALLGSGDCVDLKLVTFRAHAHPHRHTHAHTRHLRPKQISNFPPWSHRPYSPPSLRVIRLVQTHVVTWIEELANTHVGLIWEETPSLTTVVHKTPPSCCRRNHSNRMKLLTAIIPHSSNACD